VLFYIGTGPPRCAFLQEPGVFFNSEGTGPPWCGVLYVRYGFIYNWATQVWILM